MDAAISSSSVYPASPANVPEGLAKASSKYKFHAWLALGGLFLFGLIYLGLASWFGYSAWRILVNDAASEGFMALVWAFCSAVLCIFLIKGLFFKKRSSSGGGFEIKPDEQPVLFDFLYKVADEVKAPRPHKVYLSPSVNACVFYDLSLLNFLFPTRKNLDIGLGLINVLTLSEFKAVLSHEFGHFAQRTMAVGRWVYIAQQVANQLIYHRDALDSFLNVISRIDLRIAWIGWLIRLIVWSLRSILDSLLSLVMLAERALSREMEFQADLVAVSTTGSDALVHGLFRLPAADQAWEDAKEFIGEQLGKGYKVEDVFTIQSRILQHQRRILDDPDYAGVPPLPESEREQHRIFSADIAQPPQMWATHPQSHLREQNAKNTYVPAELDDRSAWNVFVEPEKLRIKLSAYLFEELEQKTRPMEATLQELDQSYKKEYYNPRYRGVYLGRSLCDHAGSFEDLWGTDLPKEASEIYPASLVDDLEKLRNLSQENALLVALRDRTLEPPGGVIRFRGDIIKRSGLGEAIETSTSDLEECYSRLREHDRKCRAYHRAIARQFPGSWEAYLTGLCKVIHYSDHKLRDLGDAMRKLNNTFSVVIADGNVSQSELGRLLSDADDLYAGLAEIYRFSVEMILDSRILGRLEKPNWSACLEEKFTFPAPSAENIGQWLDAVNGWVGVTSAALNALREAALEELLNAEAQLAFAYAHGKTLTEPPVPSTTPRQYRTLVRGNERSLQKKLNAWDAFQTASGFVPATARFLVSFSIVATAIYFTLPMEWKEWIANLLK